jgi:zinc transport system substrate-binding protein
VLAVALGACSGEPSADVRPLVAVSVVPQKYVVDRIAGELVRVAVMIPPGASTATHEPSIAQLKALDEAVLYLKVGHPSFPFERAWLDAMLAEHPDLPVLDGSEGLESRSGDPHVWVAPRHVEQMAIRLEGALGEILPQHRRALTANLAEFRATIDALDTQIRDALAGREGGRFLVFHPAWGYFAAAYGLEQVSIEHEHKEPDPHELAELIELAREQNIGVVFVQPQFDASSAEMLAREIGARVEPLDPLAYDWEANLRRVTAILAEELGE